MNNPWNKDIHDRLKDFPKKAPEGLLDDIKSEMVRRGLTSAPVVHKRPAALFRIASVAAMLLVLFGISYLFQWKEAAILPTEPESAILPFVEEDEDDAEPTLPKVPGSTPVTPSAPRLIAKAPETTPAQADSLIVEKDTVPDRTTADKKPEETPQPPAPVSQRSQWAYTPNKRKNASFDLGVYYSGVIAQMDPTKMYDYADLGAPLLPPQNSPNGGDEPNDSTAVSSRAISRSFSRKKGSEEVRHHLPVKLGVSFRYYLSERWNIQSGLTYSYLASDMSYSGQSTSYQTKQKLHYIGIPLQVGLRIWEHERFRGYISAGGQVEKLLSGKATTHYTQKDEPSGTLIETISDKKLLFSALASIGAEYMLGKDLSLYAEPGIHYYFKNGNGLQTHYNEQPLNLNITIGFRFHWKK